MLKDNSLVFLVVTSCLIEYFNIKVTYIHMLISY